jgi:hypothetical protein
MTIPKLISVLEKEPIKVQEPAFVVHDPLPLEILHKFRFDFLSAIRSLGFHSHFTFVDAFNENRLSGSHTYHRYNNKAKASPTLSYCFIKKAQENLALWVALFRKARYEHALLGLSWALFRQKNGIFSVQCVHNYREVRASSSTENDLCRCVHSLEESANDLQSIMPSCPQCLGGMAYKEMSSKRVVYSETDGAAVSLDNPHNGAWFWGCMRFPACGGMVAPWLPEEDARLKGYGMMATRVLCPVCKDPMTIRVAKKGRNVGKSFYGCINYPVCKGTLSKEQALARALIS